MAQDPELKITRSQLSKFLPDADTIRQFEELFRVVQESFSGTLTNRPLIEYNNIDHTLNSDDYTVVMIATTGTRTITLPQASVFKDNIFELVAHDSNAYDVNIINTGTEKLNGTNFTNTNPFYLISEEILTVQSDGSNWRVAG